MNKEIIDLSEQLQTQANNHVIELMKKCSDKTNYQDAINVWLFLKLAELVVDTLNCIGFTPCPFFLFLLHGS